MRRILRILLPILVVALVIVVALSKCNPNTPVHSSEMGSGENAGKESSGATIDETDPRASLENIEFEPSVTSLYIARDGSILTAEITDFSNKDYESARYDAETLKSYVTDWVDSYNAAKGRTSVKIQSIDVANDSATLILYYDSVNTFMDFQGVDYGITSLRVASAQDAARSFALSGLKDTEGKSVTPIDALQDETVTVAAISGSGEISFAGEVKYLSDSLTLVDSNTVHLNSKTEVFIIFK